MNARTTQVYKSACRMCHGGCGVLVHVVDGAIQSVEGDPNSPLNEGRLCLKGPASVDIVHHPDRLTHPMKRLGARGEGRWARIGWDEAYDIIAEKLERIIVENGPGEHCHRHRHRAASLQFRPQIRQCARHAELVRAWPCAVFFPASECFASDVRRSSGVRLLWRRRAGLRAGLGSQSAQLRS